MKILLTFLILIFTFSKCKCTAFCDTLGDLVEKEVTSKCMDQLEIVCNNPSLLYQMFDASSKYPISGMTYSSNRDLGNFDQCLNLNYEDAVKGKFCALSVAIVNVFLQPIPSPFMATMKAKMLAEIPAINYTKNLKLSPSHRDAADSVSITLLSLCVPDACTPEEVGKFFIWGELENWQIPLVNFVDDVPCITKESNTTFKWGDIVFTTFLALILALMVESTVYDFIMQKLKREIHHPLLIAFSVLTNGKKLLQISTSAEQIQCLNGIRFISMMWIIAGHGFIAMESLPLVNYAEVDPYLDNPRAMYGGASPIAVDTFFFLSGFLLTYGYLKAAIKLTPTSQMQRIPMMILHRYLRLTPALAVAYFASITIFRLIGTGPLWEAVSTPLREQCERHWWPFFLYIQNYVNYNDICLNHTWYLSADMQMFILAPIVLIPTTMFLKQNKLKIVLLGLVCLTTICIGFPMLIRFLDWSIDNVYDTHSRLNNYLIGVILGVIMREFKRFPFTKIQNLIIWCIVLNVGVFFNLYYHSIVRIYEHTSDTLFYGLYRPLWSASLGWMIYSCYHGYGGPVNWLLSLPAFQIGGRLSYCMYLLHAIVQMYWVGLTRTTTYWGDYLIFYNWCGHFIVTMILSTVWTLAFESPMIMVEKFIFGAPKKRPQKQEIRT